MGSSGFYLPSCRACFWRGTKWSIILSRGRRCKSLLLAESTDTLRPYLSRPRRQSCV